MRPFDNEKSSPVFLKKYLIFRPEMIQNMTSQADEQ
jgi:hypothetical protein